MLAVTLWPSPSDPNRLIGPVGVGDKHFVPLTATLPYRVNFANDVEATAPAQRVEITNQLDPDLDWETIQFTEVGFGDVLLAVPHGSQYFETSVDTHFNDEEFQVEINLTVNTQTGLLKAVFQSLDPDTGLPPDVLTGFLPPEDGTGSGIGHFSYTVEPKADLPTGREIRNIASITFDRLRDDRHQPD